MSKTREQAERRPLAREAMPSSEALIEHTREAVASSERLIEHTRAGYPGPTLGEAQRAANAAVHARQIAFDEQKTAKYAFEAAEAGYRLAVEAEERAIAVEKEAALFERSIQGWNDGIDAMRELLRALREG